MSTNPAIQPLPSFLAGKYESWHSNDFQRDKPLYEDLVENGQHPHSMVISCCDSRVLPTSILGAQGGDLFVHRNIANLVPPASAGDLHHGTAAAVEFAVMALKVSHIIVMGHSGCGGIQNGYHVCGKTKDHPLDKKSSIYKWLELIGPAHASLPDEGGDQEKIDLLEKRSVVVSLENLAELPCVKEAVDAGALALHGLWHDIASGTLMGYEPGADSFVSLAKS